MFKCKRCKKPLDFEKTVSFKIEDVKEVYSKYIFYVKVFIVCERCKYEDIKNYYFFINCTALSSLEIEKRIKEKIKKKLKIK